MARWTLSHRLAAARRILGGFTLVELLVTIAVLAVLLAMAAPSFSSVIRSSHLSATANELLGTVQLARNEAQRRNGRVTICASSNGTSCSGSSDWSSGWLMFHDSDRNGALDPGETVLRTHAGLDQLQLLASSNIGSAITFRGDGLARTASGALLKGRLAVCNPATVPAENVREVVIATGARASTARRSSGGNCTQPDN